MAETREKISLRRPPGLLTAGRSWADSAGVSFTAMVEDSLRDRLGISPESVDYRLAGFDHRLEDLRRRVERLEDSDRRIEELERRAKLLSDFALALVEHLDITPAKEI